VFHGIGGTCIRNSSFGISGTVLTGIGGTVFFTEQCFTGIGGNSVSRNSVFLIGISGNQCFTASAEQCFTEQCFTGIGGNSVSRNSVLRASAETVFFTEQCLHGNSVTGIGGNSVRNRKQETGTEIDMETMYGHRKQETVCMAIRSFVKETWYQLMFGVVGLS
jgi:hypothetical protein